MDLVLFDIDGTLLRTRGAGREALDEAFRIVLGWHEATEGVPIAGGTDGGIVRGVAARFGVRWAHGEPPPFDIAAVQRTYLAALARRLGDPGRVALCPGVREVLRALDGRAHVGLLTGNWRVGAALKLGAVGIDLDRFGIGAFGDDAVDRDGLVPIARARAVDAGVPHRRIIVVGDTAADVSCARAGGAVAVAVETGFASPGELAKAAPDLLLPDLARGLGWLLALVG
jgi:phosphoglycolate phosphatase-like HAD superfamily hydrolase